MVPKRSLIKSLLFINTFLISLNLFAQKPGNTNLEVELWLKADDLSLTNGSNVTTWVDQSDNKRNFNQYTENNSPAPLFLTKDMNYNPALEFSTMSGNRMKLAGPTTFLNDDNEYYIFYVSKLDNASSYSTVLQFNGDTTTYNPSVGWNGADFWFNNGTNITPVAEKLYAINNLFLPNIDATINSATPNLFYINNGSPIPYRARPVGINLNTLMLIGSSNFTTRNPFIGTISEIIVLSVPKSTGLPNTTELNKINSYLSIKYGMSLNATTSPNYYNSNGDIIWDGTINTEYNSFVFGIGRDDNTKLNQKQASNYDNNDVELFLNNLENTNAENSGIIPNDNSYILLGSNNKTTIIDYKVNTNQPFAEGSISKNIFQRFDRVYKVSNLNNVEPQNLNLKLNNELFRSTYVIVSNNENFTPASTRIYPVVNNVAKNLKLRNGDFISFVANPLPAGLSNFKTEFWLMGDEINNENDEEVTEWHNTADPSNNFINPGTTPYYPSFIKSSMNYHSSVDFNIIDAEDGGPTLDLNRARKLISQKDFTNDPTRSYFIIYISRLDPDASSTDTDKALFSLNRYNNFGWTGDTPWIRASNSASTNPFPTNANEDRTYGITINMLPNTTNGRYLSLNGIQNSAISGSSTLGNTVTKSVIGNEYYNNSGTYRVNNFFGEVLEVLVLSKEGTGVTLTSDELLKLNTYYSLKYGVSLNISQPRYVLTGNTEVYNSNQTGYQLYNKDIFGVVRDDNAGLYQKQSVSTDNNLISVYLGDLAETNHENTSDLLMNNEAVIFGSTGDVTGRKPYAHSSGSPDITNKTFKNYVLQSNTDPTTGVVTHERVSFISNYIIRAKVTKPTQNNEININFAPNVGQWLLVSSVDATFKPSETNIYKITNGEVKNITIKDGDYIGFTGYQEAPGGVASGLRMWLNASESQTLSLNNAGEILTWTDFSGNGITYRKRIQNNASALYSKSDVRTNFHPTPIFRKSQDYLITDRAAMSEAAPPQSTLYAVVNHNFATDRSYFIGFGAHVRATNARRPSFGVYQSGNGGRGRIGSTGLTNSTVNLFNPGATTIAGYFWNRGANITFDFDANTEQVRHTSNSSVMNGQGMLGLGSSASAYYLQGTMPEVIAYERELTNDERNRINSYLGLKYAITLRSNNYNANTQGNFNYQFSNLNSVWNGDDDIHKLFHNNVASIIRDDASKLYNAQSRSTDVGNIIHMGVGTTLGTEAKLGQINNDLTAVTWGHNGKPLIQKSLVGDPTICGALDTKLDGRVWLVDNTNFDQDVLIRTSGEIFPFGGNFQVYLLVADNEQDLLDNNWNQIIPMTYINDAHQINYRFRDKYTYFTFGAKNTGTCTSCDFEGEKSLKFNRTTWPTNGNKGPNKFSLGDNFNVEVAVIDNSNQLNNRYPRRSSRNSLRERRRGTAEITTTIKFFNDNNEKISSATSFNLFDIDRAGYKVDDIEVVGYCGGSKVFPSIGYTDRRPERSSYTIAPSGKATGKAPGVRYSGNRGYTNSRALAYVDFDVPVDEIQIIYKTKTTRTTNNTQEIGIGELSFYCVAPLPPPNEDGLIFTKQATPEALLCETVDYSFRIINTNCGEKEYTLTDTLPKGLEWDQNSFAVISDVIIDPNNPESNLSTFDEITYTDNADGTQTLTVTGLKAPGGGSTHLIRASAIFKDDAVAGEYNNQAQINYEGLVEGNPTNTILRSTDRLTGDPLSKTIAKDSDRPKRLITEFLVDKSCFSLDKEISVTLKINNPNDFSISEMNLDLGFSIEGVTYLANSLKFEGFTVSNNNIIIDEDFITLEDFTIPAGQSLVTLKFKTFNDLSNYEIINPITLDPEDISFTYDLTSDSSIECLSTTTLNTTGEVDLAFCTFCTQQPTTVGGGLQSDTGISTLQSKFSNWPANVPNGFLVLESYKKGLVLSRVDPSNIATPETGMIIYNTVAKCISIYNGTEWKCIERACND